MTLAAEEQVAQMGATQAMANHDRDLVHELNKRLDAVWRYDQYIANAEGKEELTKFWHAMKQEDQKAIERIKSLLKEEISCNCF